MTTPGRNDACPCGSGKKFKKCCMLKHASVPPALPPRRETLPSVEVSQLAALFDAARFEEVESRTRRLLKRHPDSGFAWKALGVALQAQGKDGVPALRKATELMSDDADAHSNLALALKNAGQLDQAAASYRRALELQPDLAQAHNTLGTVLHELGHYFGLGEDRLHELGY